MNGAKLGKKRFFIGGLQICKGLWSTCLEQSASEAPWLPPGRNFTSCHTEFCIQKDKIPDCGVLPLSGGDYSEQSPDIKWMLPQHSIACVISPNLQGVGQRDAVFNNCAR